MALCNSVSADIWRDVDTLMSTFNPKPAARMGHTGKKPGRTSCFRLTDNVMSARWRFSRRETIAYPIKFSVVAVGRDMAWWQSSCQTYWQKGRKRELFFESAWRFVLSLLFPNWSGNGLTIWEKESQSGSWYCGTVGHFISEDGPSLQSSFLSSICLECPSRQVETIKRVRSLGFVPRWTLPYSYVTMIPGMRTFSSTKTNAVQVQPGPCCL